MIMYVHYVYMYRFSFLDFTEYNSSETSLDSGVMSGRSLEVQASPRRRK